MFSNLLTFLLETLFFVLIGAALLRSYMNALRMHMNEQPGRFAMAVTDWLVQPLRRVLPKACMQWRIDVASFLAAGLLAVAYALLGLAWQIVTQDWSGSALPVLLTALTAVLMLALHMLLRVALQLALFTLLAYVIISWTQPGAGAYHLLARLTAPMLAPLRRILPIVGGVDISALVLMLLLQMAMLVV